MELSRQGLLIAGTGGFVGGVTLGLILAKWSESASRRRELSKGRSSPLSPQTGPATALAEECMLLSERAVSGENFSRRFSADGSPLRSPKVVTFEEDSEMGRIFGLGGYSQSSRVLLCMVGLPARGKSYITKMLIRYLRWSGFPVKAFNAGNIRRSEGKAGASASFFKDDDQEAINLRERIASACMLQAIEWLRAHTCVCVAIFDATNTTIKRRSEIVKRCKDFRGITPVFVESICDQQAILEQNYALKLGNDDYAGMDPAVARADFMERVKAYEKRYETILDDEVDGEISYIKLFNVGQKVVMHQCSGYLMSQIGFFLSHIHIQPRCIWLTRHAESEDQLSGVLGSHSGELTEYGRQYCRALSSFLRECHREMSEAGHLEGSELLVLMGTAPVHYATLQAMLRHGVDSEGDDFAACTPKIGQLKKSHPNLVEAKDSPSTPGDVFEFSAMSSSLLNELDAGVCNGLSYDDIRQNYPELWAERERDKLHFRYPNGESYQDVVGRLRPLIIELERQRRSILVISHLAVQRCLYAYFTGCPMEDMPYVELEMHTVVELRPGPFNADVRKVHLAPTGDGMDEVRKQTSKKKVHSTG